VEWIEKDNKWLKWLEKRSFSTLFVDGNHENFNLLTSYPIAKWCGGRVHKLNDSVYLVTMILLIAHRGNITIILEEASNRRK
jgi:hypothetical protein